MKTIAKYLNEFINSKDRGDNQYVCSVLMEFKKIGERLNCDTIKITNIIKKL